MSGSEPALASSLARLAAAGVTRAATWFDDYAYAYAFGVCEPTCTRAH